MIEKNWLKIGEVSKSLGISPKELRYWESVIPEIRPRRSKGNLRYYHREELPRLAHIRDWLGEGLTVADCQQLLLTGQLKRGLGLDLQAPSQAPEAKAPGAPPAGLEQARRALAELLERLNALPARPPRTRRRREPPAPAEAPAVPEPAAPEPAAPEPAAPEPAAPEPAAKPAKPRRKSPAGPGDSTSFGPLFDLV